ncbi:hypothetical protein KPATCC21470_3351 [Kitasatospora purpeofusca]
MPTAVRPLPERENAPPAKEVPWSLTERTGRRNRTPGHRDRTVMDR